MIWGIVASVVCILMPVYEAMDVIINVLTCSGTKKPSTVDDSVAAKGEHLELPPVQATQA